jgi:ankyrin repeat protein
MLYLFLALYLFSASCGGKVNPSSSPNKNEDRVPPITAEALYKAIRDGDVEKVKELFESDKIDVKQVYLEGNTPLHMALLNSVGHDASKVKEMVEILVSKGEGVNLKNGSKKTPLSICLDKGADYNGIAKLLIDKVPDLASKDEYGNNILHASVYKDNIDMVKFLVVEKKMDVNAEGVGGFMPLDLAVGVPGSQEVINFLKLKSAITHELIKKGNLWELALSDKNIAVLKFLKDNGLLKLGCFKTWVDYQKKTPLHYLASAKGATDKALLQLVIDECKGKLDNKDSWGDTALYYAVDEGNKDAVEVLLANGANVNVVKSGDIGDTVLHWAVYKANKDIIKLLLNAKGIKVNAKNNHNETPLDLAYSEIEIKALLKIKGGQLGKDIE